MDRDLVEQARRGDQEAFETIVRTGIDAVYRRSLAILGNEADARDATQETFLAAWRQLPQLRDGARFDAWLGRIGLNAARMTLRRRGRVREIPAELLESADGRPTLVAGPSSRTGDRTIDVAERDALRRAFGRLPVEQRMLLYLHHIEGRSVDELATVLGIPAGTAKSRLHAARERLERALEAESGR